MANQKDQNRDLNRNQQSDRSQTGQTQTGQRSGGMNQPGQQNQRTSDRDINSSRDFNRDVKE